MGTLQRNIKRLFTGAIIAKAFYPIGRQGRGEPSPRGSKFNGDTKHHNKANKGAHKWDFQLAFLNGHGLFRNRTTGEEVVKRITSVGGKEGKGFSRNAALYFGVTA